MSVLSGLLSVPMYVVLIVRAFLVGASGQVADGGMLFDVLQYFTADGSKVSVRPSGTEPKIKFYIEVKGRMEDRSQYGEASRKADEKVEAVKKSLGI